MKRLTKGIIKFFKDQRFTILTTVDEKGFPHSSCKGIVAIEGDSTIYLLDLYKAATYKNLMKNPNVSITAVDEHRFIGFTIKGKGEAVRKDRLNGETLKVWDKKITERVAHRLLRNIRGEKGHPRHPEALLPRPEYIIKVTVKEVISLTPGHIQKHT